MLQNRTPCEKGGKRGTFYFRLSYNKTDENREFEFYGERIFDHSGADCGRSRSDCRSGDPDIGFPGQQRV